MSQDTNTPKRMFKRGVLVAEVMIGLLAFYFAYLGKTEAAVGCAGIIAATLDKLTGD